MQKSFNGSEEQNLSDLIVKQLEGEVLPGVYGKIESEVPAGKMRSMAFDKLSSTIDTFGALLVVCAVVCTACTVIVLC